jgi:DNA polymerase V
MTCYPKLAHSSDNTAEILHYALLGCDRIFRSGQEFKKAGIILLGLRPKSQRQLSLWEPDEEHSDALMQTMDTINAKFGRGTIQHAPYNVANNLDLNLQSKDWTLYEKQY